MLAKSRGRKLPTSPSDRSWESLGSASYYLHEGQIAPCKQVCTRFDCKYVMVLWPCDLCLSSNGIQLLRFSGGITLAPAWPLSNYRAWYRRPWSWLAGWGRNVTHNARSQQRLRVEGNCWHSSSVTIWVGVLLRLSDYHGRANLPTSSWLGPSQCLNCFLLRALPPQTTASSERASIGLFVKVLYTILLNIQQSCYYFTTLAL